MADLVLLIRTVSKLRSVLSCTSILVNKLCKVLAPQQSLMVLHYTALVPFLGLCIGPANEAGLSAGMRREHVPPHRRKKERSPHYNTVLVAVTVVMVVVVVSK